VEDLAFLAVLLRKPLLREFYVTLAERGFELLVTPGALPRLASVSEEWADRIPSEGDAGTSSQA